MRDSTEEGKYLDALEMVRPGQEAKFTAWMEEIQVEYAGKPAAAWR